MATTKTTQNKLLAKFHILLSKCPDPATAKEEILTSYNCNSSRYLSEAQLAEACNALELSLDPQLAELNRSRKRLMASIGAWLKAMNKHSNADIIIGIACRASGKSRFNNIPLDQLRSLYYAFRKKTQDLKNVEDLTTVELDYLKISN